MVAKHLQNGMILHVINRQRLLLGKVQTQTLLCVGICTTN